MDKQIQKLRQYLDKHIGKTKIQIHSEYGKLEIISDNNIWFYDQYWWFICKDEICFFFVNDTVEDIIITEYIFNKPLKNIFYSKGEIPEYKIYPIKSIL